MKINLFLDSGAYAAWKRNEPIDIYRYIDYIKRNKEYLTSYVNMDVIPGKPGFTPTTEEVEYSAKQSYTNLQIMKDAGLNPIPVFHQGERFFWLEKLLDDKEDYIGISPAEDMMGWRGISPHIWLDKAFTYVTDKDGYSLVKTHGFGVTKHQLLIRYPWTTCDSTSWTMIPNYGKIVVPIYQKSIPQYLKQPIVVHVSDVTKRTRTNWGTSKSKTKDQFGHLSRIEQEFVTRFIEECGLTMTEVRYDDCARRICVIKYYQNLIKAIGDNVQFKYRIK